jgi:hypothetical protein
MTFEANAARQGGIREAVVSHCGTGRAAGHPSTQFLGKGEAACALYCFVEIAR